jgi:hypothetical protein
MRDRRAIKSISMVIFVLLVTITVTTFLGSLLYTTIQYVNNSNLYVKEMSK